MVNDPEGALDFSDFSGTILGREVAPPQTSHLVRALH